jgi:hypothetical protein
MANFGFGDINSLSSLLQEGQTESESRSERHSQKPSAGAGALTVRENPASLAAEKTVEDKKKKDSIWNEQEVQTEDALVAGASDDLPCPRYEISYKQSVGTEDTYLGLTNKTPGSEDCSHLVIKIHFPGAKMKNLDLDVTSNRIKAQSKTHKLFTYFPKEVDNEKGVAKFDAVKEVLTVTLPIIDEFGDMS